jgi:hypothetical protein
MAFFGLERLSFQGVANANHEIKAVEAGAELLRYAHLLSACWPRGERRSIRKPCFIDVISGCCFL